MTLSITQFDDANADRVIAYWMDTEPGKGSVTITSYGSAWTCYFGGIGEKSTIKQFFSRVGTDYLINKLIDYNHHKRTKQHEKYLRNVISVVKEYIAQEFA